MIAVFSRRVMALGLVLLSAGTMAAVWAHLPLANGPRDWEWAYRPHGLAAAGVAVTLAGVALALLVVLGRTGAARAGTASAGGPVASAPAPGSPMRSAAPPVTRPAPERLALLALLVAGAAFTFGLIAAQPGGFGRVLDSLVSRNSFGFVWDAGLAPDLSALLADYPAASQGLNQHSVTHPPGPLLAVRALDGLVSRLAPAALAGAPDRVPSVAPPNAGLAARAAWALERARARARHHGQPLPERLPGAWTVVVLALLLPASSVLAAWPLYLLALECGLDRRAALLAAALWLLVPARSLFTPTLDQALPLLLVTAAWLAGRRGLWRAAGAGFLLWCACFLSYGCLAALPVLGALIVSSAWAASRTVPVAQSTVPSPPSPRGVAGTAFASIAALAGLGMLLPWGALALFTGHDPWGAFRAAIELHHKIAVMPRGYATWLLFNPYDFALLLGPPVLILAAALMAALVWAAASRAPLGPPAASSAPVESPAASTAAEGPSPAVNGRRRPALAALSWSFWLVMAALWLSGSVRGEVGRIWLPWMPFACLLAAAAAERWLGDGPGKDRGDWRSAVLLLAQAALALTLAANMVFVS